MSEITPERRADTIGHLTAEYIKAYMANPKLNLNDDRQRMMVPGYCLQLARQTVEYIEAEYNACQ